jgi:hypothetical protein
VAKWNSAIEVTFNDNDGGAGWRVNPSSVPDIERHIRIFGLWRTRWILFKRFWRGLMQMEVYAGREASAGRNFKKWIFRAEIPE